MKQNLSESTQRAIERALRDDIVFAGIDSHLTVRIAAVEAQVGTAAKLALFAQNRPQAQEAALMLSGRLQELREMAEVLNRFKE